MIHSMTGFGKSEAQLGNKKITIEVRSVNSKQADISFRYPSEFRSVEMAMRKLVSNKLQRGKIDVFISADRLTSEPSLHLNAELAKRYYDLLLDFSNTTSIPLTADPMRVITKLPGVMDTDAEEALDEDDSFEDFTLSVLDEACDQLNAFRLQEGTALYNGFKANIQAISDLLDSTTPYEEERIVEIRQRIEEGLSKYVDVEYDRSRLEQEMIYYIEKLDVNEEKSRLRNHLKYFVETLDHEEVGQGRKLGFIAQEIGRESDLCHTIGSPTLGGAPIVWQRSLSRSLRASTNSTATR